MADHHHHHPQPPTDDDDDDWLEKALAAAAYPREQIFDKMDLYDEILAGLAAAPAVRAEFVRLLREYGKLDGGGDPAALRSSAADLLGGHPDVLRSFVGEIDAAVPVPAAPQGLAAAVTLTTRRRRSDRRRRGSERRADKDTETQQQKQIPAAAKDGAAAADDDDEVRLSEALAFFRRVHETAGPVVHGRLLDLLFEAQGRGSGDRMAVEEVYERAKEVFGRAHVALLHAFATLWLPGAAEWKLQLQQQQQQAAAVSSPRAGVHDPKKKKAPAGADDGSGCKDRRHSDHVVAVLEVRKAKKKSRSSAGGSESSGSAAAAAARVLTAATTGVVVRHAHIGGENKRSPPPRRRAARGSTSAAAAGTTEQQRRPEPEPERDEEVRRRFRREWEFQTWFSKLVATSDRVTELLLRTPHGVGVGGGGSRSPPSSMEALFPLPECREFLASCYGGRWGEMRAALLERGGESRGPALEAIGRRLRRKEEEAVAEECRKRRRLDPGRVAQRLHGLAVGTLMSAGTTAVGGGGA